MDFTFGIITIDSNYDNVMKIIDSIEEQNIPNYEIIVVGGLFINRKNTTHINFNEYIKHMWITKKKNIITQLAKYDNIVYMHDYIKLEKNWYEGHLTFGDDFDILMDKMLNADNTRWRDWTLWNLPNGIKYRMLPYDIDHMNKYIYISGAYWIAKKNIMLEYPLDERLCWGQGEDVDWSIRVRNKYKFKMNIYSEVKLIKYKENVFSCCTNEDIEKINELKEI